MSFATSHRFSLASFAIAAVMTVALNGTMLMGFNQLAIQGAQGQADATRLAKTSPVLPTDELPRVVVTHRQA
jgi:hypothetical protein